MEQALRVLTPLAAAAGEGDRPSSSPQPARFTALELAAAEQLIHLSESSCSSGGAAFSNTPRGCGPATSASSSSPRSVNAPAAAPAPAVIAEDDDDDGDEQEVGGMPRRNKRYRSIAEIYDETEARRRKDKAGAGAGGSRQERRK